MRRILERFNRVTDSEEFMFGVIAALFAWMLLR